MVRRGAPKRATCPIRGGDSSVQCAALPSMRMRGRARCPMARRQRGRVGHVGRRVAAPIARLAAAPSRSALSPLARPPPSLAPSRSRPLLPLPPDPPLRPPSRRWAAGSQQRARAHSMSVRSSGGGLPPPSPPTPLASPSTPPCLPRAPRASRAPHAPPSTLRCTWRATLGQRGAASLEQTSTRRPTFRRHMGSHGVTWVTWGPRGVTRASICGHVGGLQRSLPFEGVLGRLPALVERAHRRGADHNVRSLLETLEDVLLDVGDAVLLADSTHLRRTLLVGEH
mmetsp:Transcript_28415/g.75097  ORF Transcript_28415/g.75097 Transcript_28415/m.75097 type:complete len:283 (-) Transcript_28415:1258-2106(-)